MAKKFLLCFHDFSVWNFQDSLPILEELKEFVGASFSVLVIPDTAGASTEAIDGFKNSLAKLREEGFELALHGYKHKAEFSQGRGYLGLFAMNLTGGEAEFAGLSKFESDRLLQMGIFSWKKLFEESASGACEAPVAFVPPTWWSNPYLHLQVRSAGMLYEDRFSLTTKKGERFSSPVVSFAGVPDFSIKPMFNFGKLMLKLPFGIPRIALHPVDFPKLMPMVRSLIVQAHESGCKLVHYKDL